MYWAVRLAREVGVCLTCKSSLLETLANHTCAANAPELAKPTPKPLRLNPNTYLGIKPLEALVVSVGFYGALVFSITGSLELQKTAAKYCRGLNN